MGNTTKPLPRRHERDAQIVPEQTRIQTRVERKDGKKIVTTVTVVTTDDDHRSDTVPQPPREISRTQQVIRSGVENDKNFQKRALERHNFYRAKHGVPPLKWCPKCAKHARAHATRMAETGSFAHSGNSKFGENLFSHSSSRPVSASAEKAIDSWYDEVRQMRFGEPTPNNLARVGHFTQVVWKDTSHVGMDYVISGNTVYVVANYLCPGNFLGDFHRQVYPPRR